MKVALVPYWSRQREEPVNPDRKVQLNFAFSNEFTLAISPVRRLLAVSGHREKEVCIFILRTS